MINGVAEEVIKTKAFSDIADACIKHDLFVLR